MNTTDQFAGNTHKQTEQVVVEDLTCKVNQISESIEKLQKTLADIKSSLEVPELKGEISTMQRKSEFIGRHSRTLEGVYTKVTRMTDEACAFKEFVRRQFYDFTFYNLKAAHSDLNTRIADLKSVDTNFTKEENERLQILLADERGREKQVEQLETMRTQLFSTVCKFTCMRDVVFVFFCMLLAKSHSFAMPCQIWCGNSQKNRKLPACVMEKAENLIARYPTKLLLFLF